MLKKIWQKMKSAFAPNYGMDWDEYRYLSQSCDVYDIERRQRAIERRRAQSLLHDRMI